MTNPIRLAVVPVAGLGTRMLPLTRSIPKEMLPVGQRLCIDYIVEELLSSGIEEIIFVVSPGKERLAQHFEFNSVMDQRLRGAGKDQIADQLKTAWPGLQVQSVYQHQQLGLGHAVLCAREAVRNRPFVVALGDAIIETKTGARALERMLKLFQDSSADVVVAFQKVAPDMVSRFGIADPGKDVQPGAGDSFKLAGLVEKPSPEQAPSDLAICARYVLSPQIFDELENTERGAGGEIQLTDAIYQLIQKRQLGFGVCLNDGEKRIDVGSVGGYLMAFVEMAMDDPKYGDELRSIWKHKLAGTQ